MVRAEHNKINWIVWLHKEIKDLWCNLKPLTLFFSILKLKSQNFAKSPTYIWHYVISVKSKVEISQNIWTLRTIKAGYFYSFLSGSWPLPLKLSLKSYQMPTFFIQNVDWVKNDVIVLKMKNFGEKTHRHLMIFWWQLESQRSRAREKKEQKNSA